jgi:hypothetical protein
LSTTNRPDNEKILEPLGKTIQERASVIPGVAKTFEGITSVVAWQVAVVSPGFLGLLWNARDLAAHTRLPHAAFNVLFMGAELAFLLAIVGSVVLHNFATDIALKMGLINVLLQDMSSVLTDVNQPGGPTKELLERLKTGLDQHDDLAHTFRAKPPARVVFFGKAHGASTLIGYVSVGILIVMMKLF